MKNDSKLSPCLPITSALFFFTSFIPFKSLLIYKNSKMTFTIGQFFFPFSEISPQNEKEYCNTIPLQLGNLLLN